MSIIISTNVSSLNAQKALTKTQDDLSTTINRLSTGHRLNQAKDNAAGYAIASSMTSEINGLKQGSRNGNDGISLIQTAESGLNQTLALLQRMLELSTQGSSGTYATSDLANMDTEYQSLMTEVDRISSTTDYNGVQLMNGSTASVSIQIGTNNTANDRLSISLINTGTASLGITSSVTTNANAQAAMALLNTAMTTITTGLAGLGASQSHIEGAVSSNADRVSDLESARSRIVDTDFAEESANLAKLQILQQSGAAMLSQANASGQIVLKLLQS